MKEEGEEMTQEWASNEEGRERKRRNENIKV